MTPRQKELARLTYECEDCIGMKDHGCYCRAVGAVGPGGPLVARLALLPGESLDTEEFPG